MNIFTEESEQKLLEYADFYGELWPEIYGSINAVARQIDPKILELYIECNGDKENLKNLLKAFKGKAVAPQSKLLLLEEANAQALGLATQGRGITKKRKGVRRGRPSKKLKTKMRVRI